MFCEKCGQEVLPGNTFCTNCGEPVKQPAAGEVVPAPVSPPPATPSTTPAKPKKGISRKWIIITAAILSAVVVAAVVLVLVFVVFKSPGPESTMNNMFKAMEENSLSALMKTVDPSVVNDKDLKNDFRDYMKDSMPPKGTTITGLKYETKEKGDNATVKLIGGTAKMKVDGKTETLDLAEDSDNQEFSLVKKDGKWYLTKENFMDFFAKLDLQKADTEIDDLSERYQNIAPQIEQVFADFGANVTSMQDLANQLQERVNKLNSNLDTLIKDLKAQAESYELVYKSENAGDANREYAKLRLDEIDILIKLIDRTKQYFNEVQNFFNSLVNNPNVTSDLIDQGINEISQRYDSDTSALNDQLEKVEEQIESAKDLVGL